MNKHLPAHSHLILTDPYLLDNELLLKPFRNQLKVHYCPINPSVNFKELNKIVNSLRPRHIISPYTTASTQIQNAAQAAQEERKGDQGPNPVRLPDSLESAALGQAALNITYPNCVLDQINSGQTIQLSEQQLGSLKYRGKCPTSIASLIKMQSAAGGIQLSRVTDL